MSLLSLPEDLHQNILFRLPGKSLLTCKRVCKTWFSLISYYLWQFDIFLRLPVKSLLACRCVSKLFNSILSDPTFVKGHLNYSVRKNDPHLVFKAFDERKGNIICSTSYQSLLSASRTEDLYDNCVELDYMFNSVRYTVQLLGSCDGLVCLLIKVGSTKRICLLNPATKEYKIIHASEQNIDACTFGYDYKARDYMLVNVVKGYGYFSVIVYTLRSNSWKNIQTDAYKLSGDGHGVFVNGIFHLLVATRGSKVLISLDISNNKFVEVQLPEEPKIENNHWIMNVGMLDGCLSVLVKVNGVRLEIWMMQNYGVQESWTKRCVITHDRIMDESYLRLMWSFRNGEILLATYDGILLLYDTVRGIVQETKHPRQANEIEIYSESLISLRTVPMMVEKNRRFNI